MGLGDRVKIGVSGGGSLEGGCNFLHQLTKPRMQQSQKARRDLNVFLLLHSSSKRALCAVLLSPSQPTKNNRALHTEEIMTFIHKLCQYLPLPVNYDCQNESDVDIVHSLRQVVCVKS